MDESPVLSYVELLPCPFCGSKGVLRLNPNQAFFWAECSQCQLSLDGARSIFDAIQQWDTPYRLQHLTAREPENTSDQEGE